MSAQFNNVRQIRDSLQRQRPTGFMAMEQDYVNSNRLPVPYPNQRSVQGVGNMNPSGMQFINPMGSMGSPFQRPGNYGLGGAGYGVMTPMPPGQIPPFDRTPR